MKIDFENYLRDQHALDYTGLDDDMYDNYIEWTCSFDYEDWIAYANLYANKFTK